ncbi:hypothetical protein BS50DRAFT_163848 [Corynespora cassiicola Philippines]|uniref:Uncharacterized protein n=1 Tax=Corynespora cassiicola Philippines TaxID=1448308 RepID=A0A2T2N6K8_CORCC|nr:hypothetical protein BS50DRAFT_163848 [Corynespora cassiicola Philippines]
MCSTLDAARRCSTAADEGHHACWPVIGRLRGQSCFSLRGSAVHGDSDCVRAASCVRRVAPRTSLLYAFQLLRASNHHHHSPPPHSSSGVPYTVITGSAAGRDCLPPSRENRVCLVHPSLHKTSVLFTAAAPTPPSRRLQRPSPLHPSSPPVLHSPRSIPFPSCFCSEPSLVALSDVFRRRRHLANFQAEPCQLNTLDYTLLPRIVNYGPATDFPMA